MIEKMRRGLKGLRGRILLRRGNQGKKTKIIARASQIIRSDIFTFAKEGVALWVVLFAAAQAVISGGRYSGDIYVVLTQVVLLIFVFALLEERQPSRSIKRAIKRGVTAFAVFAVLQFLVVNLLLEKNSLAIYRFWGEWTLSALVLLFPLLAISASQYASRLKVKIGDLGKAKPV